MERSDTEEMNAQDRKRKQNRKAQKRYRQKMKHRLEELEKWREVAVATTGQYVDPVFHEDTSFIFPASPRFVCNLEMQAGGLPPVDYSSASLSPDHHHLFSTKSFASTENPPLNDPQRKLACPREDNGILMVADDESHEHAPIVEDPQSPINYKHSSPVAALYESTMRRNSEPCKVNTSTKSCSCMPSSDHEVVERSTSTTTCASAGATALHLAVDMASTPIVTALLRRQVDANVKDAHGRTALHLAAGKHDERLTRLLCIASSSCINSQNYLGDTPLHVAVATGDLQSVRVLLSTPGIVVDIKNKSGRTALHNAVVVSNEETIEALLEAGANIQIHVG
ncbi:ankyrin [Pseudovirgaria hyperparasitica]|uniref:Ankyrin n=1 Tax=Pseudovirgaria hyperparasitica TaxID=470096 RepID=A0A6A6W9C5_9PEZI|nr:ankyrin [Pseudovirgaria hyperparasitica]KAF2758540.1 ankyrin [Pseudovirgaria hyperparasitica]